MPVSTRTLLHVTVIVLGLWLAGCSGRSKSESVATAPPVPDSVVTSLREETIRQARVELEKGEALAHEGQWRGARLAFDRAVDLLLTFPGGVESSSEAKSLYDDLVATIHEVEREYLAQLAETEDVQSDVAAVDELTEDVSHLDSAAGLEDLEKVTAETKTAEIVYDIPIELNARVLSIIEMFQTEKRDWFQEALDRGAPYLPMFHRILEEEGVPKDLVFLSMVESAYKTRAVSRAGARGMWQFIAGTGKLYGLRQDYWVDDRFDPEKATRAAARHLRDLYDEFGDWYLAMSAYNAGPRRIERAVKKSGIRDFWTLAQRRFLPRETRSYVPLIVAATVIGKNPEAYGFTRPSALPLEFDAIGLDHPVDLETAARSAGTTVDELKLLNPELRHWVTPLDRDQYELKVPKGSAEQFVAALAAIPEEERVRFGAHTVRRGDTLSRIAARYGTSVQALTQANRITARTVIHPGQVLTVPVPPGSLATQRQFFESTRESIPDGDREVYVVSRGDTLGAIARSFRMSLESLRSLNDLPPGASRIHPGQRLVVSGRARAASRRSATAPVAPVPTTGDVYTVRSGDTLGGIADAHRISLSALRRMNGMSSRATRIYPGQKLVVGQGATAVSASASASGATSYRIRRGDTLSRIARRFGVRVDELRQWNQIDSDRIVVGQSLTIHTTGGSQ